MLKRPSIFAQPVHPHLGSRGHWAAGRDSPQWVACAFLGTPKGAALVFPSQKLEPGIETWIPEKSPRLQPSVLCPQSTNTVFSVWHSTGENSLGPALKQSQPSG